MKTFNIPDDQLKAIQKQGRTREYPYYRPECAEQAKILLDKLHSQGHPIRINKTAVNLSTIRLQYYQGVHYLIDHLDENNHYKKLFDKTVCRSYDNYLELHIKTPLRFAIEDSIQIIPWKEDLAAFLETAKPNEKFYKDNLDLLPEELTWIENQLSTLVLNDKPLFYGQVEKNKILLIRDE